MGQAYLEIADQKAQEHTQMMNMAVRLNKISIQISSKETSMEMVKHLDALTPVLNLQAENTPIEQMYGKLESFNNAYDNLVITDNIMNEGMHNAIGQSVQHKNVDTMMKGLQAEVNMEMGVQPNIDVNANVQQQQNANANTNFYDDLKNI